MDFRFNNEVTIPVRNVEVEGELIIPQQVGGIIIFSHGSGSSRLSPRNRMVARYLNQNNFGTLLLDLLTEAEDLHYHNRFDIELLTKRLIGATEWLADQPAAADCRIGYFGASTGAASALKAAACLSTIGAVVSRGGRPDLAMDILPAVASPTLLIVGSLDPDVLKLNKKAYEALCCEKKLKIVEGAGHLFEEYGMMEKVASLSMEWFKHYLVPAKTL